MRTHDSYSNNMADFDSNNDSKLDDEDISHLHLVVEISDTQYCVPVKLVSEIIQLPKMTVFPTEDNYLMGTIKLRDEIVGVINLRRLLRIESLEEQEDKLFSMLEERKKDHINYVNELVSAARERRKFSLTTDPHSCRFGKWYDAFETDDINLREYMRRFDVPHKLIHTDAHKIINFMGIGDHASADKLLEEMQKSHLPRMISLFDNFRAEFQKSRRLAGVVVDMSPKACIPVDIVTNIVSLEIDKVQKNQTIKSNFIKGFVTQEDDTYILLSETCFNQ